jgi:epoxyqueuosine reductase
LGDPTLARVAEQRLSDASPLVRAMAVWALSKLLPRDAFERLAPKYLPNANDAALLRSGNRPPATHWACSGSCHGA